MDSIVQSFAAILTSHNSPYIILVVFFAGILSSLSPCSLGILPLIIAYVGGTEKKTNAVLFLQMLSFSLGLALVMSIIGIICALTGKVLGSFASPVFVLFVASLLLIFGLGMSGIIEINFPNFITKMPQNSKGSLFIYPFIIGVFFAFISSPCSTPILAAIMALATLSENIIMSIAYLFAFALGECVIIILCALFTNMITNLRLLAKYNETIIKISGIILCIIALIMMYIVFKPLL